MVVLPANPKALPVQVCPEVDLDPLYLLSLFCGGTHSCVFLWVFQLYARKFMKLHSNGRVTVSQNPDKPNSNTCKLIVMQRF